MMIGLLDMNVKPKRKKKYLKEYMILFSEHLSNNYKHQNEYLRYTTKNKFVKLVEKLKEEYKIISCSEKFYYSDLYDLDE